MLKNLLLKNYSDTICEITVALGLNIYRIVLSFKYYDCLFIYQVCDTVGGPPHAYVDFAVPSICDNSHQGLPWPSHCLQGWYKTILNPYIFHGETLHKQCLLSKPFIFCKFPILCEYLIPRSRYFVSNRQNIKLWTWNTYPYFL